MSGATNHARIMVVRAQSHPAEWRVGIGAKGVLRSITNGLRAAKFQQAFSQFASILPPAKFYCVLGVKVIAGVTHKATRKITIEISSWLPSARVAKKLHMPLELLVISRKGSMLVHALIWALAFISSTWELFPRKSSNGLSINTDITPDMACHGESCRSASERWPNSSGYPRKNSPKPYRTTPLCHHWVTRFVHFAVRGGAILL